MGWEQGTELDWLQRLVSFWADEFDWRAWERKLNALKHFTWEGIHFVHQRAESSTAVPLVLTHGWPGSFLDYVDMLPMLKDFDVVVPSLPGYGFSPRPREVGINYRYVGEKWRSWSDVTPSDDFLCATLTLYWATQTITSSMRDYWDNRRYPVDPSYVDTPTAFGVFAHETVPEGEPPRSYLERLYNIRRWTVFPRGGHFAPVEEPAAVAGDLTAFFRAQAT